MALTRRMLEELGLAGDLCDAVLRAHTQAVNDMRSGWEKELTEAQALRDAAAERDSLREQLTLMEAEKARADETQAAFDAYRQAEADAKLLREREKLAMAALRTQGVSAGVIPLLMKEIDWMQVAEDQLDNTVESLREKWPECFPVVKPSPASGAHERMKGRQTLTAEDVRQMSHEEINANWQQVTQALRGW